MSGSLSRLLSVIGQHPRVLLVALFLYFIPFSPACAGQDIDIAVLYPEASPAHTHLYQTIIKGMQAADVTTRQRTFDQHTPVDELQTWIREQQAGVVVVLGKASIQLSQKLDINIPLITGAHILTSNDRAGVSLDADPELLFRKLKQLSPGVQRVFVIHKESSSGWLVKKAAAAARKQGLQLQQLDIEAQTDIAAAYSELSRKTQRGQDAIWLPLDPAIPTQTMLPELLKVAWEKDLVIFGNNPIDVKKGILFAMYPDYANMGKQLVAMARARKLNPDMAQPEPSRYLKIAVNRRTASHLGIAFDPQQLQQINLIYPRQ